MALDLHRPVGRYSLNLSRQLDRFVAQRLQLASALEHSWVADPGRPTSTHPYFINWINASLNGQPLDRNGLKSIRDYTIPGIGMLRLDYVSYRVRAS